MTDLQQALTFERGRREFAEKILGEIQALIASYYGVRPPFPFKELPDQIKYLLRRLGEATGNK